MTGLVRTTNFVHTTRAHSRKLTLGLCVALLLMLLVVASSKAFSTQEPPYGTTPKYGGTLVIGMTDDPKDLNPVVDYNSPCWYASSPALEGLVKLDYGLNVVPSLAQSWEISPSADEYTFHLVKNATWHDGVPFTSADVKFSLETTKQYHPQGKAFLQYLDRIDTPDNYTVVLYFTRGNAPLLRFLTLEHVGAIIPMHLYENTDILNNPYNLKPIGTGPFKFKEWVRGEHITYVKNEQYYKKGEPYLDSVVYKIIPSSEGLIAAFEAGEINAIPNEYVPMSEFETLTSVPGTVYNMHGAEEDGAVLALTFNLRNPILGQEGVRQAIDYALDKQGLMQAAVGGFGTVAEEFNVHTATWSWNPDVPKYGYNVTLAGKMLDELGYPKGADGIRFKLNLKYTPTFDYWVKSAEVVKDQLAKVGIAVDLVPLEYTTFADTIFIKFDFDLTVHDILCGPDIESAKTKLSGEFIGVGYWTNEMGYNNTRVNQLFDLQETQGNQSERAASIKEIQSILMEELPAIPIFEWSNPTVFKNTLGGWIPPTAGGFTGGFENIWSETGVAPSPEYGIWIYVAAIVVIALGVAAVYSYRRRRAGKAGKT